MAVFKMATCADCNQIAKTNHFTGDLNRCPTKAEIVATDLLLVTGTYADNQCVSVSDIYAKPTVGLSPTTVPMVMGGGSFYLNITSNTSWTIKVPAWCSAQERSGTGNASVQIVVNRNTGSSRSDSVVVTATTEGVSTSASCVITQGGKPTITLRAYGIDVATSRMEVAASQAVADGLLIGVNVAVPGQPASNGTGSLTKGARSVWVQLLPKLVPNEFNYVGVITNVNGDAVSPYEADNAIYTW